MPGWVEGGLARRLQFFMIIRKMQLCCMLVIMKKPKHVRKKL